MVAAGSPKDLTVEILAGLENQKLPGDAWAVGQEIRAGYLPGDAKSHPGNPPAAKPVMDSGAGPPPPLIPLHTFHPAVVHFPIALFLFGVFLEAVGAWRSNAPMRQAGFWNLVGSAVSLAIVVPTGLAAFLRMGMPFAGALLTHFVLAVAAALSVLSIALWRRKGPVVGLLYWIALAVASILVMAAGHFGAAMVYG